MRRGKKGYRSMLVCFTGIDGSGKSTLANMLAEFLVKRGIKVQYIWMRMNYMLTKPLLMFCRFTGLTRRPVIDGQKISIHEFYRVPIIASLVQYLHTIDTIIKFLFRVYLPLKFSNRVIICDRFIYDVLIDFAIEGQDYSIFNRRVAKILQMIVPDGTKYFLVIASREKLLKRRPDVIKYDKDFNKRYKLYEMLSRNSKLIIIDNDREIQENFNFILKQLGFI